MFLSAVMMFRRFVRVLKHAWHEEDFARIAGAALALVIIGTLTYRLGGDWSVVDGFSFAVTTLTASSSRLGISFIRVRQQAEGAKAAKKAQAAS